jgi:hypothetical protein
MDVTRQNLGGDGVVALRGRRLARFVAVDVDAITLGLTPGWSVSSQLSLLDLGGPWRSGCQANGITEQLMTGDTATRVECGGGCQ